MSENQILHVEYETSFECTDYRFTWDIKDFAKLHATKKSPLRSPQFSVDLSYFSSKWNIDVYDDGSNLVCCISFGSSNITTHATVEIKLWIILDEGTSEYCTGFKYRLPEEALQFSWSRDKKYVHALLKKHKLETLTFFCQMMVSREVTKTLQSPILWRGTSISHNLIPSIDKLRADHTLTDVTLQVKGKFLKAHKLILAAMSPVFKVMFQDGTKEQQSGQVNIEDIDTNVFEEFLRFIYTGSVRHLPEMAEDLLAVADKYEVQSLKYTCIAQMLENLSADNATRMLVLVDRHSVLQVKPAVVGFIRNNFADVAMTDDWMSLRTKYPHLAKEIYHELKKK